MAAKTVNSVLRGAEILKCLSEGIDRITDISGKLQLAKGTVHRLLKTLEISKLVREDPATHRY